MDFARLTFIKGETFSYQISIKCRYHQIYLLRIA